jgi:DNA-binding HxlR family transcriptional regulator
MESGRVKGYGQFCPVAKAVEVLAERWTLLVVRELLGGARRFNDIHRGVPLMSPSLLTQRLRTLERAGLLERRAGNGRGVGYHLTEAGEELRPVVALLGMWGQRWVRSHYTAGEFDAGLLLWDVRRFVAPRGLGDGRVVVNFRFRDGPAGQRAFWLVLDADDADLCLVDPGHEVDLEVDTDMATLTRVWMGDLPAGDALAAGALALHGPRALVRRFPEWFTGNPLSSIPPARRPPR